MADFHASALALLRKALGDPNADFREGQFETVEALVARRSRILVVQRTGWGKSAVYFLATRLLRDQGAGPALLVSPLLALMRDQVAAAQRLGVRAETVNSTNRSDWQEIGQRLAADQVDLLLISPERLANDEFLTGMLLPQAARIGLLVVDEAHCISDWGHDFRPDYRRIVRVLDRLPRNVPVCATTATGNSRVTADVAHQLGAGLVTFRGPLVRASIRLQTVTLPHDAAKLAWLAHHLRALRKMGTGIVYAHTQRWTERIALWLQGRGFDARPYHADIGHETRLEREQELLDNRIDALVATTALGMGYDKRDVGFVVHFHQPASVVHYYQQVGRAGRAIDRAYGVMLSGGDDRAINDYFIEQAFPPEEQVARILAALEKADSGLSLPQLESSVNLQRSRIEKALKVLSVQMPAPVAKVDGRWTATPVRDDPARRRELAEGLAALRRAEQAQMQEYARHTGCLMEFLARALDDPHAGPCGRCAMCVGKPEALRDVPPAAVGEAVQFLRGSYPTIEPRKQWPPDALPRHGFKGKISDDLRAEQGRALCILGDAGWGHLVEEGKYQKGAFAEALVDALANLVRRWAPAPAPTWVACIPSGRHPALVPELAQGLARRLGLPFAPGLAGSTHRPQKEMENSWQQAHNLDGAFQPVPWKGLAGPVLLVDDLVDSGWTLTVAAAVLRQAGSGPVFPVVLATNR